MCSLEWSSEASLTQDKTITNTHNPLERTWKSCHLLTFMCVFRGTQKIFRVKMNSALCCQAPKRSQRLSIRLMHCNLRSYDALCKGQTETFINVMWKCILSGLPSMQMQMQSLNMQSRELRSIDIGWQGCKHFYKWFFFQNNHVKCKLVSNAVVYRAVFFLSMSDLFVHSTPAASGLTASAPCSRSFPLCGLKQTRHLSHQDTQILL